MSVNPASLTFASQVVGTSSAAQTLTVRNSTGTTRAVTIGTFPAGFARATAAQGGAGSCGTTLGNGASCTINIVFSPTAVQAYSGTLAITTNGGFTVANSPVSLTGTGAAPATVSITPNPLTITLPSGTLTGTSTVTFTNTAAAGGSSVAITNVSVTGAGLIWSWAAVAGADTCTGTKLAPGASCTVGVRFSRVGSVGTHVGAITFTDNGVGSPQSLVLTGIAQ
jgi:hypothetical protein